ncbi:MAG: hypothetical protein RIR52_2117 [Acidobacteriota bacterium]
MIVEWIVRTKEVRGVEESFLAEMGRAERTLARRDPVLRGLIDRYGPCTLRPHSRHFETLVNSIVSQQLSTRAAATIFARFRALYPGRRFPSATAILETPDESLRGVGLSFQKIGYIRDLAEKVGQGGLRPARLTDLDDAEVIRVLTGVKGIGVWTAQMFLIFSLGRLDVLPVGDLGIRKAIRDRFGLAALPEAGEIEALAGERRWAPWRSVASWYLWRSLEN